MFEGSQIIPIFIRAKDEFLSYQIVFHCSKCHRRILATWENDWSLEGRFVSGDGILSEVLDCVVYDPINVICYDCLGR
jgi:hypothetical protein